MKAILTRCLCLIFLSPIVATPSGATFHLWDIQEVYSNADGSVQFIELFTTFNSQQFVVNHQITTATNSNVFVFPSNSPSPTSNRHLLLATEGFGALPGGVVPDFTIPANFFDATGDTINFVGADMRTFAAAPTNGIDSLGFPGATVDINSPTNFAGITGSVNLATGGLDGDFNDDGFVNIADYTLWRDNVGTDDEAVLMNNGDGLNGVDAGDYAVWKERFAASTSGTLVAIPIPEPGTGGLLLLTLLPVVRHFPWRRAAE